MSQSTISTFQLFEMFPDEETARKYLEDRLWPLGAICPQCGLIPRFPKSRHPPRLESALKLAVRAAAVAEKHGQSIGYSFRFSPSDIRAMAISVLIQGERHAA